MCRLRFRNANGGHSENRPVVKFDRKSALATAVMSTATTFPGNFRLKCDADRRMVQTSARWNGRACKSGSSGTVPPCSCGSGKASRNMLLLCACPLRCGLAVGKSQSTQLRRSAMDSNKPAQNIQDSFLNTARKERASITIYLLSGVKLTGRIRSFDKYSVVLEANGQEQLIFKHAISTVVMGRVAATHGPHVAHPEKLAAASPVPAAAVSASGTDG